MIFVESVVECFQFLKQECGFTWTLVKLPNVIYTWAYVEVQIFYDGERNRGLDLGLRYIAEPKKYPFSVCIHTLLRLHGEDAYQTQYPSTPESIRDQVARLARVFRKHDKQLLHGNAHDFEVVSKMGKESFKEVKSRRNKSDSASPEIYSLSRRQPDNVAGVNRARSNGYEGDANGVCA